MGFYKFNTKVLNLIDFGNLDDSNESERFRGCYNKIPNLMTYKKLESLVQLFILS